MFLISRPTPRLRPYACAILRCQTPPLSETLPRELARVTGKTERTTDVESQKNGRDTLPLLPPEQGLARFQLEAYDVGGLRALGAFADFKLDCLAVGKVAVSLSLDRGEMHEHIGARLALNESEAFTGVKPLYCSLFFQLCFLFLMGYLVPLALQPKTKKAASCMNSQPL